MKRRSRHSSNGKILPQTSLPKLPSKWHWMQLGELAAPEANSITDGPFGSKLKTEHYTDVGPRVIRLQNIGDAVFRDAKAHVSEEHFESLQKHRVFPNDLVIAALGEALPRACLIPDWVGPAIVKADCIRLKANERSVHPSYLCYALNSETVRRRTSAIIHGVGRPRLNLTEIKSISVPIAPLNEQHRIVEKIEELFSDLDSAVAALERARANLKRYRASVLKAAIEGALTAEWRAKHPDVEPASKLLERILTERRKKWEADQLAKFQATGKQPPKNWRDKYKEPAPPCTEKLPKLPDGWCWTTIDTLLREPLRNGHSARESSDGSGIRTLTLTAVTYGNFSEGNIKYTIAKPEAVEDLWIEPGDILIERSNTPELVGTSRLFRGASRFAVFPDLLIRIRVMNGVSVAFVDVCMQAELLRGYFRRHAKGLAGSMPKIDQATIAQCPIPLPPRNEQDEIADLVDQKLSQIQMTQEAIDRGLKRAAQLRQSILKQAFVGKLVPQDPSDEPAPVLLKRICGGTARALPNKKFTASRQR